MDLVRLPERPEDWDREIQRFRTRSLFHESAWLDYLKATRPRSPLHYFEIRHEGSTVGYFCVVQAKKIFFSLYGSPLPGMGMYQGPLVNAGVDQVELVKALMKLCRTKRIAGIELASDWLEPDVMRILGFHVTESVAHLCPLPRDEDIAWSAMRGVCRTRIRKALKNGLEGEITDDDALIDHFYEYMSRVLPRRGMKPEYGIDWPRALKACLSPADRLFPVWVKYQGRIIGAGLYPHDDRTLYFWDGASDPDYLHLGPNDLLHWTAMREAIRRGLSVFNMAGGPVPSRFTRKFGGVDVPYNIYRKNFLPFLESARSFYHRLNPNKSKSIASRRERDPHGSRLASG